MKKRTFSKCILILIIVLYCFPAQANVINILSQEYVIHSSGSLGGISGRPVISKNHDESSNQPISHILFDSNAHGFYNLESNASGGVTSSSVWVDVSFLNTLDDAAEAVASNYISASITFIPLVDKMLLWYDYNESFNGVSELVDETTGISVYTHIGHENWWLTSYLATLDLSHTYTMTVEESALGPFGGRLRMNLKSVPEPATMLLLGLGLIGLAGARKKFYK